jgi:hypothetical protein
MAGFIADAIGDRQKARAQTQHLEARAQMAWAKENAKVATLNAREKAKQGQREAREREIAEGHAEAEAVTRSLQGHLTELWTLLTGTLEEDPYLPWDRFKVPLLAAEFKPPRQLTTPPPQPQTSDFMPEPLTGLGALAPGRKRAHAAAVAQGQAAYDQAIAAHAQAERRRWEQLARAQSDHEQSVRDEWERVQEQHAIVDQMARDFTEGRRKAVSSYFSGVLSVQRYPTGFPTGTKVAYLPPDRELRIDIDLPLMTAIPELEAAEYLITKKELKYKSSAWPPETGCTSRSSPRWHCGPCDASSPPTGEVSSSKPSATVMWIPSTPQRARTHTGAWSACRFRVQNSGVWT